MDAYDRALKLLAMREHSVKELKNKLAMSDYGIDKHTSALTIRIGNKDDAEFQGGFNIFGKAFGDFEQDLILTLIYDNIDACGK